MNPSKKIMIGLACLLVISFIAYSYISNHNNPETNNIATIPSNTTNIAVNTHHYQVRVNEVISLGERTK